VPSVRWFSICHPNIRSKVRSAFRVGCAEVSPAKRAVDPGNSDSNAFLGLPGAERSARWILDDRHAPRIHNIERWSKNFAAQLLRLVAAASALSTVM